MKEKLLKNMGYLIVLLDVGIYFILSYIFVKDFQVNILSIIVNGSLLFIGALIATMAMMRQGILIGRDSEKYKETLKAHIEQKKLIYPKLNNLQLWLDNNYLELLKIGRTVYINSAGYNYEDIFSEDGKYIDTFKIKKPEPKEYKKWYEKIFLPILKLNRWIFSDEWRLYREKKSYIRKARKYKVTRLTVSDLLNVNADKDPNNFGITENQYQKRQSGITVASRLIFSVLLQSVSFGFYGFNLTTFLVQLLSVVMIIVSSLFAMFNSYSFMVKTHRETIIKKINKLEEYYNVSPTTINAIEQPKTQKNKESLKNELHSKISVCPKGDMVEEIHGQSDIGETNNLCSN